MRVGEVAVLDLPMVTHGLYAVSGSMLEYEIVYGDAVCCPFDPHVARGNFDGPTEWVVGEVTRRSESTLNSPLAGLAVLATCLSATPSRYTCSGWWHLSDGLSQSAFVSALSLGTAVDDL